MMWAIPMHFPSRSPLLFSLLLITLAGCGGARLSENQCAAGDWETLGHRDGAQGWHTSRLLDHQDVCGSHGVVPDRERYLAGWRVGIREYCSVDNAFDVGVRGQAYRNVCPQELEGGFMSAYRDGRDLYRKRADIGSLQGRIAQCESRLSAIDSELLSTATAQVDESLSTKARLDLLAQTHRLYAERGKLERDLPDLRRELRHKERELESLDRALAAVYF